MKVKLREYERRRAQIHVDDACLDSVITTIIKLFIWHSMVNKMP